MRRPTFFDGEPLSYEYLVGLKKERGIIHGRVTYGLSFQLTFSLPPLSFVFVCF